MVISGLAFFGVNVEESNFVAGTAILGRIKPVTSILAEKGLACFRVVCFSEILDISFRFSRGLKFLLFLVTDRLLSLSSLNP